MLAWFVCLGLLAWVLRGQFAPQRLGHWQWPSKRDRIASWVGAASVLFFQPSPRPMVRALRVVGLLIFACFVADMALEDIVVQSPYRSMLPH